MTQIIEAMLLRWGESHSSGRTVTLLLPDDGEGHPFKGLKCGPEHGQRLKIAVGLVNDDETMRPAHGHKLSNKLGIKCTEPTFRRFLWEQGHVETDTLPTEDEAVVAVRAFCGVESRSNIDGNPEAEAKCRTLIGEYEKWNAL